MKAYRDLAQEFIDALRREIAERQRLIKQTEKSGPIFERPSGGSWSDIRDREIALFKQDISSYQRTIAQLEEELRDNP